MSIALAERLKRELTDKYVVVVKNVPELRRFAGLTGRVKTVNMNGRALVQFDGPEDIGWYDIDPSYLIVVDKPLPKEKPAARAEDPGGKRAIPASATAPKAVQKPGGKSPLEMARAEVQSGAAKPAPKKALSPLEQARAEVKGGGAKPAAKKGLSPLEQARAEVQGGRAPAPAPSKPLSPLERARQEGTATASETPADAAAEPAPVPPAKSVDEDLSKLSPLERARREGNRQ